MGVDLLAQARQLDTSKLPDYAIELLDRLIPLLEDVDPENVGSESEMEVCQEPEGWGLEIRIEGSIGHVSEVGLNAHEDSFYFWWFGGEVLEIHSEAHTEAPAVIDEVIDMFSKYFGGFTIVEDLNRKGRVKRVRVYWGEDTDSQNAQLVCTSVPGFRFLSRTHSTRKSYVTFKR
jgi:hypothetical protein